MSGLAAGIALAGGDEKETEVALPAATVTRAINTAVAAQAGNVAGVEIETENGVTKIDVEVAAKDGKKYEVGVNASTGKVIAVEADNENEAGRSRRERRDERTGRKRQRLTVSTVQFKRLSPRGGSFLCKLEALMNVLIVEDEAGVSRFFAARLRGSRLTRPTSKPTASAASLWP